MINHEYVPVYVHLNPVSFGAHFASFEDKPLHGPYRTEQEATSAVIATLGEGDLSRYFTTLRNNEIAAINAAIRANSESLVPCKPIEAKPVSIKAEDVRNHKPPFKGTNGPEFGAMAKLVPVQPKLPPQGGKAKPMRTLAQDTSDHKKLIRNQDRVALPF